MADLNWRVPYDSEHQCLAVTKAGARCVATALHGKQFCVVHDTDRREAKTARRAYRKGNLPPVVLGVAIASEGWPVGERLLIMRALRDLVEAHPELRLTFLPSAIVKQQ